MAKQHEAVLLPCHVLLFSDDADSPEWVTYQYRKAHPVLRWLPSKLAEWLAENMQAELCHSSQTGYSLYSHRTEQHPCNSPCAKQIWGTSEDMDDSSMGM